MFEPYNRDGVNTLEVLIGGGWMSGRDPSGSNFITYVGFTTGLFKIGWE